ncbi:serine/threonine-protein kinase/endoribonuclease IRE1-like isoform X2 [Daphnia pulex]|uniref:serine/threonine-protein kinase/endoribonuclease IRE1-like isoform X2 n=1 Tax=Daphnia pulex TaxID=6669 RepID=UPI001EDEDCA7|nr:serine/threonine-protein kinase/endoribonuclease IRE1-like isoform X2 [Daphnia pulex]
MAAYKKIGDTGIQYAKEDVLGRGTFGIVYLGIFNEEKIAVKKILLNLSEKEGREVDLQKNLSHENVLKICRVVEDDDFRYIVLELCAGTLSEVIENSYKGPALPSDKMVLYQIADGLDYIHSNKLIHRDIKPENILISMAGKMKLSDFGLSKQISTRGTCSISGIKGTLLWMAPEFFENIEKATPKCDIFPCGCVFFVFLTRENGGIHPFGDTNDPLQIQFNIREGKPVNIEKLNSDHFALLFVRKMIERDPSKRISLQMVKNELKSIIFDFPQLTNNYTRENNATKATVYDPIFASGSFKKIRKGKYTQGERAGEACVSKTFISGSVFEDSYFQAELKVVEKALEIINNFNKQRVINQTIWLNKPEIWTGAPGSKGEGGVIENGAVITDPIIMSSTREYGPTDLGDEGISNFFAYHTCNIFCDSKWIIPHNNKTYFEKWKGSSMVLSTKLTELKLVNQIPEQIYGVIETQNGNKSRKS